MLKRSRAALKVHSNMNATGFPRRQCDRQVISGYTCTRSRTTNAANRVIGVAVLLSGALAAVVAVMLTVQTPLVTPDFALRDTIIVLAGVVLGGMNRPIPATLGGFAIGFATGLLGGVQP